jgi:hypothetical protein
MGSYDEIHAGTRCGQTKALGRYNSFVVGDHVRLVPSLTVAQAEANEEEGTDSTTDFQIAAPEGGFLIVRASVLTGWDDDRDANLPLYGNYGHPLDADELNLDGTLPRNYLWWDVEKAVDDATRRAGEETESDKLLGKIFGGASLAGLDPISDAAEIAERRADLSARADEDVRTFRGLPGDCPVCAAVRAGTVQEYRTRMRHDREQTRAAARARRQLNGVSGLANPDPQEH